MRWAYARLPAFAHAKLKHPFWVPSHSRAACNIWTHAGPRALCSHTHTQNSMLMRTYHEVHSTLHNSVCVRALGGPHTCIMIVVLRPARNCHSHNPSDTNPSATPHNCHPPPDTRALLCACAAVGSCASVQMCTRARARLFWHWAHICIAVFVHLF